MLKCRFCFYNLQIFVSGFCHFKCKFFSFFVKSNTGYVLWALLMKNNPVSRISVFGLLIPVVNTLLSALLNGEPLFEWQYLAALVLVCGGIFLVNRPRRAAAA